MLANANHQAKELYEFGPFRVDAEKETLLRAGEPVPLTPKTFQILLVLVRRNKELVTKDELMSAVWPDTFVEEANLSRNIFMLRKALGESPEDHRYVLTVPGRGYRFAEDVRLVAEAKVSVVAASHSTVQIQVKQTRFWALWISTSVIVLLATAFGAWRIFSQRRPVLSEKDTVVLADFANSTGDSDFDETLRQGLAVELGESPFLSLVPDQRLRGTLHLMGRPENTPVTGEVAREICERTFSAAAVQGAISRLGGQYVVGLRASDCRSGSILDDEQVQVAKKEDVLNAVSQIASKFRRKSGESLATIKEHETPLVEATTPSFEAWKLYSAAWKLVLSQDTTGAVPLLQRATEIDPQFAMAYALLGHIYGDAAQPVLAAESVRKAYDLREHATDPERFFIVFSYQTQVTGNLEEAERTGESWVQTYPRVLQAPTLLSAAYQNLGKYERSAELAKRAVDINPDFPFGASNLGWAYLFLERYGDAESTVRQAAEHKLGAPDLFILPYVLAFYKGDQAEMQRAATAAKESTEAADWMTNIEGSVAAYSGHLRQARTKTLQAVNLAQQAHQEERAAIFEAGAAVREALLGNAQEARVNAQRAVELSKSRDVEYGAAFALAVSGDDAGSQTIARDLETRFPEDTLVRFTYLPVLRALSALNHGRPSDAIEQLQVAAPYDLAIPGTWFGFFGNLYPVYVRGQAYLKENRNAEAAGEFQKILDHPGIVCSDPVGLMARVQLARAYVASGDRTKARSSYEAFLALWKDADEDVPVLRQAQAEHAKLR